MHSFHNVIRVEIPQILLGMAVESWNFLGDFPISLMF